MFSRRFVASWDQPLQIICIPACAPVRVRQAINESGNDHTQADAWVPVCSMQPLAALSTSAPKEVEFIFISGPDYARELALKLLIDGFCNEEKEEGTEEDE